MLTELSLDRKHKPEFDQLSIDDDVDNVVTLDSSAFAERLRDNDLDGARKEYANWLGLDHANGIAEEEAFALISLLWEKLSDKAIVQAGSSPVECDEFRTMPGESYTTSTHFSLLTAAIFRQRQQIRELMQLIDDLLRRHA